MSRLFWVVFWGGLSVLLVVAGIKARARKRAELAAARPRVDDDAVRSIVETGALAAEGEEPLDLREIDQEEERFWLESASESWDEPEEL